MKIRLQIIFTLLALSALFYYFGALGNFFGLYKDFWINSSAGAFSSIVTILFIENLIVKGRDERMRKVNKIAHSSVLLATRHIMAKYMLIFSYIEKSEFIELLDNAENKFTEFLDSDEFSQKMNSLDNFNEDTGDFLSELSIQTEHSCKWLTSTIEEVKPYPDPTFLLFLQKMPSFEGKMSVGTDIIQFFYNELPKKVKGKETKEMLPGMNLVWKIFIAGFDGKTENVKDQYIEFFQFLLKVNAGAKREELFYIVD